MKRIYSLVLLTALAAASQAQQEFKITFTDTGPQPLSPLFYSASTAGFDLFDVGGTASLGIKHIAEMGNATSELGIAGASSAVGTYGTVGGGAIGTGQSNTVYFTADALHPYFSFASMLGKTNDGFIGESVSSLGLKLFNGNVAQSIDLAVYGTRAWDAGTEKDTQNAADLAFLGGTGNPAPDPADAFVHHHLGVIPGVGDSWQQMPAWTDSTELAHIQVQAVPEPGPFAALGVGALMLARRRRKSN